MTHEVPYGVPPFSDNEKKLIESIDRSWSPERARRELEEHLQVAIEVELATIPIYLFTYYSIERTPQGTFPDTALSRFADRAGSTILSVAVEEMLHMSLSSNILFSLGVAPQLYLRSPGPYPTNLPGHTKLGPDHEPLRISLAKLSGAQLWSFLEIEYPPTVDAPPEGRDWETIGQIYSYIRCIIASKHIQDDDFKKGERLRQIQPTNYSPNSIDTVYPSGAFEYEHPEPPPAPHSAASVAQFSNRADSHTGKHALLSVSNKEEALQAIATISFQGEGYSWDSPVQPFDDPSEQEPSHYWKFLVLQSQIVGYPRADGDVLPPNPPPPPPAERQIGPDELRSIVYDFPDNPVAASYPPGRRELADVASGLYQYMLIMTESIFLQPPKDQKRFFNQAIHRSMIWILDKILRGMRDVELFPGQGQALAPTFENINLGTRDKAFATLTTMCRNLDAQYGGEAWYAGLKEYVDMIPTLPDVSALWAPPPAPPSKYQGAPKFPASPPDKLHEHELRHACMGLNGCQGQGRTRDNACAGQGYCSTALEYNYAKPSAPKVSDHTCHVKNACAGQGGCGLYGTGEEQESPGQNECKTLGSCATPINAERFSTDGKNQGQSVWLRARAVFAENVWPGLRHQNPNLPADPPPVPGTEEHPDLFAYGPSIEWIEGYSGQEMTACGSSGMSGAGRSS
jgi:hypothetical protein